jgi:hypothetical protein
VFPRKIRNKKVFTEFTIGGREEKITTKSHESTRKGNVPISDLELRIWDCGLRIADCGLEEEKRRTTPSAEAAATPPFPRRGA